MKTLQFYNIYNKPGLIPTSSDTVESGEKTRRMKYKKYRIKAAKIYYHIL